MFIVDRGYRKFLPLSIPGLERDTAPFCIKKRFSEDGPNKFEYAFLMESFWPQLLFLVIFANCATLEDNYVDN